ncbi:MAG TPA: hypothetical protein VFE34_20510 [Dongiaceae bacterium]|nr:hypothetical protein [Dongiaceae bacterium]
MNIREHIPVIIVLWRKSDETAYWKDVTACVKAEERRLKFDKEADAFNNACASIGWDIVSDSEEEWTNDEFKAKHGKEDQEPAPKGCSTYALTDCCSDPHTQQRGNDRKCGQGNIPKMESSATSQARRKRNC